MEFSWKYCFSLLIICLYTLSVHGLFTAEHQDYDEFSKEVLKRHNELRKVHNGKDSELELSKELSKDAKELAKKAARDSEILEHPPSGHNVLMACTTYNRALTGKEVTDSWYDEVCHPAFRFTDPDSRQARSFTQVVWKASKTLGVGHAVTRKNNTLCTYAVAIYKPNGNVLGKFADNVQQGSFEKEKYCKAPLIDIKKAKRTKTNLKGKHKGVFVLNKNPPKPSLRRRTLYYKIPVDFVTASDTGSTFVVPRKTPFQEESAFRRSQPTLPESSPAFDSDSLSLSEFGSDRTALKEEENKNDGEENADVQADYIKDRLDQEKEQLTPDRLKMFEKPLHVPEESEEPSFENVKMMQPERKTIEDEYAVNKIALEVHNALRKIHKVPPMKLSPKISIAAENYAKFLAESDKFEHAKNIAENLAFSCNTEGRIPSVAEAIKDWYQEACLKDYDFDKDPSSPGTAHFTQIVWASTKLLGIGRAIIRRNEKTCTYFVARYEPAGNWVGQFKEKVKKGDFNSGVCQNLTDIIKEAAGNTGDNDDDKESTSSKPKPIDEVDKEKNEKEADKTKRPEKEEEKEKEKPKLNISPESTANEVNEEKCLMGTIDDQAKFAGQSLRVHNYFRRIHNSSPLMINEDLVRKALEDAKTMCLKQKKRNQIDKLVGENVGSACNIASQRVSAAEAVTNWYKQVCDRGYKFDKEEETKATSKFSQLVWKSTSDFGIAFATKKTKDKLFCTYVVAKYSPSGNKAGAYKENVLRGSFTPSICDSLNTIAFNAAIDNTITTAVHVPPSLHNHWSFGPEVANQVLKAVSHEAGTFEPFKVPIYHKIPRIKPLGTKRCVSMGSDNPICRAEIEDEGLRVHNYLRKIHGAKDLKLSPSLSLSALNYAKTLLAEKRIRNSDANAGESIAVKCSQELTVGAAIKAWYREACDSNYDFTEEGFNGAGHFTQIVWQGTELLGIGKSTAMVNGNPCTIIVARYEPPGNVIGQFRHNVKQGEFTKEFCKKLDKVIDTPKAEMVKDKPTKGQPANPNLASSGSGEEIEKAKPSEAPNTTPRPTTNANAQVVNEKPTPTPKAATRKPSEPSRNKGSSPAQALKAAGQPIKLPGKNKGINPAAAQKHPSKTLKGETKPGAKQERRKPVKKPAKILALGQTNANLLPLEDTKEFSRDGLRIHNTLRSLHASNDLILLDRLTHSAQKRCKGMIEKGIASQGKRRNMVQQSGENLVILCDTIKTDYAAKDAILNWYSEACENRNSFAGGSYVGRPNHFTQMIWRSTSYFGMAKVDFKDKASGDFCSCVVAMYEEPGNYIGKVKENVKQGQFDPAKCSDPELILADAQVKYKEKKEEENVQGAPTPPQKPGSVTKAPPSPTAPTTVGPPGSAQDSVGMPTPTSAIDFDATSPTPITQFTVPASTAGKPTQTPQAAVVTSPTPPTTAPSTPGQPTAPTKPKGKQQGKPQEVPQEKPQGKPQEVPEEVSQEKPQGKPQEKPKGKPLGVSPQGQPQGGLPEKVKPQGNPQGKPQGKPEEKPSGKPQEKPLGKPQGKPQGKLQGKPIKPSPQPESSPSVMPTTAPSKKVTQPPISTELKTKPITSVPTRPPVVNKPTTMKPTTLQKMPVTEKPRQNPEVNAATTVKPEQSPTQGEATAAVTPQQQTQGEFELAGLQAHNKLRFIHSSPQMTLNDELSKSSAAYAKVIAEKDVLEHSDSKDGENLAMGCSSKNIEMSATQATKNWYKEACSPGYQFGDASAANEGTGHFTQVVWKGSTILGIGRFTKETKRNGRTMYCTYIVARYRPAGNWQGQYAENVIKGTFSPTKTCENLNKILADVKGNRKSHAHLSRNKPAKSDSKLLLAKKDEIIDEERDDTMAEPLKSLDLL